MCLRASAVRSFQRWRWSGDEIVSEPVIPAARTVPGTTTHGYAVDVREFLGYAGSAVVRHALDEVRAGIDAEARARFAGRAAGSFDERASAITRWVGRAIRYGPRGRMARDWLLPSETLAARAGDCEDIAFLLAAMLEASGISPYCARVAFGCVGTKDDAGRERAHDHAWVAYLDEGGAWEILEPLALGRAAPDRARAKQGAERAPAPAASVEYVPHFVLNRHHLWRVRSSAGRPTCPLGDYLGGRRFWEGFDPTFAAGVHASVFDEALGGIAEDDLEAVKRASLVVDANTLAYDPRDHFDFAYVDEGWDRVGRRIATGDLRDFALAAHAIGDFYAHSTYADWAIRADPSGRILPYDPARPRFRERPRYDFSPYAARHGGLPGCDRTPAEAAAMWEGKIVSGQWWRWFASYPDELQGAAEVSVRRSLPDHDWIAVDGPEPHHGHVRYDEAEYAAQFAARREAAVEHLRTAWDAWRARRDGR